MATIDVIDSPKRVLPDDVAKFIEGMTSYREELKHGGTGNEVMSFVREEANDALKLCKKYGVTVIEDREYQGNLARDIYSDGSKGEWS